MTQSYKVTFTPFVANNVAQITTTATVSLIDGEVLWEEPIIIDIREGATNESIDSSVTQATSGFEARVSAIRLAREFQGKIPLEIQS